MGGWVGGRVGVDRRRTAALSHGGLHNLQKQILGIVGGSLQWPPEFDQVGLSAFRGFVLHHLRVQHVRVPVPYQLRAPAPLNPAVRVSVARHWP